MISYVGSSAATAPAPLSTKATTDPIVNSLVMMLSGRWRVDALASPWSQCHVISFTIFEKNVSPRRTDSVPCEVKRTETDRGEHPRATRMVGSVAVISAENTTREQAFMAALSRRGTNKDANKCTRMSADVRNGHVPTDGSALGSARDARLRGLNRRGVIGDNQKVLIETVHQIRGLRAFALPVA